MVTNSNSPGDGGGKHQSTRCNILKYCNLQISLSFPLVQTLNFVFIWTQFGRSQGKLQSCTCQENVYLCETEDYLDPLQSNRRFKRRDTFKIMALQFFHVIYCSCLSLCLFPTTSVMLRCNAFTRKLCFRQLNSLTFINSSCFSLDFAMY